jgi:predicted RNA-binding Zn-ribbon protein involved in translation (DUF1610 family)
MDHDSLVSVCCRNCENRETQTIGEVVAFLRQQGRLRRDSSPTWEFLVPLWQLETQGLGCSQCGSYPLELLRFSADEDWDEDCVRVCEACSRPIDKERLEIFPDTVVCSHCQGKAERGEFGGVFDYCPRCGSHLGVVAASGRSGAYQQRCNECGYRSS